MRLFTAVYPSEAALSSLDLAVAELATSSLRWVPREQRHVTLAFHGEVPDGAVDDYAAELEVELGQLGCFEANLAGGGSFGGRTLWTGIGTGAARMRALSEAANQAAACAGIREDFRAGSRPHLTLARARAGQGDGPRRGGRGHRARPRTSERDAASPAIADLARALAIYQGPVWLVSEVAVVASQLGAGPHGGPLHRTVASVAISQPQPGG